MGSRLRLSLDRVWSAAWPVAQAAAAAGVAWFLAYRVLGHSQPVFAPTAAVVALAANVGGRGRQAFELLVGVGVGVAVGELLVLVLGTGAPQVSLAAAGTMLAAAALLYSPLPLIQAGGSAVLVVALQSPGSGGGRVLDALVGGSVALFVSQILFPPSPVSLLAEAGRQALGLVAGELRAIARALNDVDAAAAEAALRRLHERQARLLADLTEARETAGQIARRTLRGRWEAGRLQCLDARLGEADYLFVGTLLLAHAARRLLEERGGAPGWLHHAVERLARAVEELAGDPELPGAGRRARRAALEAAEASRAGASDTDLRVALAADQVRLVVAGVLRAAGEERPEVAAKDPHGGAYPDA